MSKREQLRKERRAQAEAAESKQKRVRTFLVFAGVIAVSVAFVVGAILLQLDKKETSGSDEKIEKLLAGIPQKGLRLGNPDAPRVLLEWGDMQCAACASFANDELPEIIRQEVRPGKLQIEFRQWPILGPESNRVGRAALAASLQNRYWQFLEYYYTVQTPSPSDELLEKTARRAGVEDIEKWKKDIDLPRWEEEMLLNDEAATEYGFSGTPSFATKQGKEITPLGISAPGELLTQLQEK
jgi:protein-disulfide isomerase